MAAYDLTFVDTFLNELLDLPRSVQNGVKKAIKVLASDPISAGGDAKKLKGYKNNVYRTRLGDYRLFYSFGNGWVKLLSVRKRDEQTYERELPRFVAPESLPDAEALDPRAAPAPLPAAVPVAPALPITTLPRQLTPELLQQWLVPEEYWSDVLAVRNSEAILDLSMPDQLISRLLDNLYPRPIAEVEKQREYVLNEVEDLDRYVEGSLTAFLLKLDPEQQKLREFGGSGPTLVKGGPGTGKSTLALYRVETLLERGQGPVLFTTYTNALVRYSEQLLEQLLGKPPEKAGVKVGTVDGVAYRYYVAEHGKPVFASEEQSLACLEEALKTAEIPAANAFDRQVRLQAIERLGAKYLLQEFLSVVDAWGISTVDEYLKLERRGRGVPLKGPTREAVWAVYEAWKRSMAGANLTTWEELRRVALEIASRLDKKPYGAVVVDEAQDLSPVALRFLVELSASPDGIYLTADASQSLYQRGFSWKQVHSDLKVTGRTLILKRNYRNTAEIAAACAAILEGTEAGDADSLRQEPSPHSGDVPAVHLSDRLAEQARAIAEFFVAQAKRWRLPVYVGAVLCPKSQMGKEIAQELSHLGLQAAFMSPKEVDIKASYVKVLTLHSAKGLEFPFVAVVGLNAGALPNVSSEAPEEECAAASDEQRRLFYVGCSRAMRSLLVCGSRSAPSEFLATLREPTWRSDSDLC